MPIVSKKEFRFIGNPHLWLLLTQTATWQSNHTILPSSVKATLKYMTDTFCWTKFRGGQNILFTVGVIWGWLPEASLIQVSFKMWNSTRSKSPLTQFQMTKLNGLMTCKVEKNKGISTKVKKQTIQGTVWRRRSFLMQCEANIWIFEYIWIFIDKYIHSPNYLWIFQS